MSTTALCHNFTLITVATCIAPVVQQWDTTCDIYSYYNGWKRYVAVVVFARRMIVPKPPDERWSNVHSIAPQVSTPAQLP